jgi:hypothetical protein
VKSLSVGIAALMRRYGDGSSSTQGTPTSGGSIGMSSFAAPASRR